MTEGSTTPLLPGGGPAPTMRFGEAVRYCFEQYFTFSGRGSRSQYWWFALFVFLAGLAATLLEGDSGWLSGLLSLAVLVPSLAVASRRFHDAGWSFWWYLLVLVPLLGWIFVIYVAIQPGEPGPNRFG